MIVISIVLVLGGFVALLLGVLGVGDEPLRFVYGSIGACLVAAVLLVAGVLRARPSRSPAIVDDPRQPSWSGAAMQDPGPAAGRRPAKRRTETASTHVQVLSAREAAQESVAATDTGPVGVDTAGAGAGTDDDATEQGRFVRALDGLDLDAARIERLRGRFVTPERLAAASVDEIAEVPGITPALAGTIAARVRSASGRGDG